MLGIHGNPNLKEFLKSSESFLKKYQFSTLADLNPGFGGTWDMLGIYSLIVIFIILQNKSFCQIFFLNFTHNIKSPNLPQIKIFFQILSTALRKKAANYKNLEILVLKNEKKNIFIFLEKRLKYHFKWRFFWGLFWGISHFCRSKNDDFRKWSWFFQTIRIGCF